MCCCSQVVPCDKYLLRQTVGGMHDIGKLWKSSNMVQHFALA